MKRRKFLKTVMGISGILAVTPFVPIKDYLITNVSFEFTRQKIGDINELPPGSRKIYTYPVTGNPELDGDPFRKFLLLRLPDGSLKSYSAVCLHLWCLVDYKSERNQIECPCHGSIYDPNTGIAIRGPASLQFNKTLPEVKIEVEENGDIYANGVVGVIGYGKEGAV